MLNLLSLDRTHPNNMGYQHRSCVSTILDKIVGTSSYVFFKVLKNFHNQELTCKPLSVR